MCNKSINTNRPFGGKELRMPLTEKIRNDAEVTKYMTIGEAHLCKGILGYIIPANLQENGFHAYRAIHEDGTETKTLIILKEGD